MEPPLVAVIMAGGQGTRLYPASRPDRPKQFLTLGGNRSLLERTVSRAGFADERYVLAPTEYTDLVRDHAPGVGVLEEPAARDTGPALVYATERIRQQVGDCVLLCLPSDHHVVGDFEGTAREATRVAVETGGLVTIGVEPDRPATGYGYIQPDADETDGPTRVEQFVEKPDSETATSYVDRGWYWNAGMFAWTPSALLDAATDTELAAVADATRAGEPERAFEDVRPVNVDRALLEGADDLYVVPASFEWDDLGTWDALGRVAGTDDSDNATVGDVNAVDTGDCVLATDGSLDVVGIDDLVVASFGARTLVVPRDACGRVRSLANARFDEDGTESE